MSNEPLDSIDFTKLLIFFLIQLPIVLYGVGIIPVIFLLFGLYMTKKTDDFSHISIATKNYEIYMKLALLIGVLCTLYFGNKYVTYEGSSGSYLAEEFYISLFLTFVPFLYLVLEKNLFYKPLFTHREWVEKNGFFAKKTPDITIVKGESRKTYSVADELTKWAKLKENGHISKEEFEEAKTKILKRQ